MTYDERHDALCREIVRQLNQHGQWRDHWRNAKLVGERPWYEYREGTLRVWDGETYAAAEDWGREYLRKLEASFGFH
jgi:hypothetical protein